MENTLIKQDTAPQATGKPESLQSLSKNLFVGDALLSGLLTAPRARLPESLLKVEIKPVLLRGERKYQFSYHLPRKVTHRNLNEPESRAELVALLTTQFKQGRFHSCNGDIQITLNKRNEVAVKREPSEEKKKKRKGEEEKTVNESPIPNSQSAVPEPSTLNSQPSTLLHDRVKNHILPEGQPVPFLVKLGVMSADGKVITAKRDKFRQINRFLEMVADVSEPLLERARQYPELPIKIVDFGCGKGYLTFALYHYLHTLRGVELSLLGVDLKQDVLTHLTALAKELNYTGLAFLVSDIQSITLKEETGDRGQETGEGIAERPTPSVDLVVALHACDTATDDTLAKAIAWEAQVILAAPCCQHELFNKIHNDALQPMLRHGIVRERLNSLITDTLRAEFLTAHGYQVQMLEFVDVEHTPKNLLIRAVRRASSEDETANAVRRQTAHESYTRFRDFWNVQPYLEQALPQAMSKQSVSGDQAATQEIAANERE